MWSAPWLLITPMLTYLLKMLIFRNVRYISVPLALRDMLYGTVKKHLMNSLQIVYFQDSWMPEPSTRLKYESVVGFKCEGFTRLGRSNSYFPVFCFDCYLSSNATEKCPKPQCVLYIYSYNFDLRHRRVIIVCSFTTLYKCKM